VWGSEELGFVYWDFQSFVGCNGGGHADAGALGVADGEAEEGGA